MLKLFYPCAYVKSVFDIDYERVYELGYRGLVFDIDNTLVPHGKPSTPEVDALFARLNDMGFRTMVLSDNYRERVDMFLENINALSLNNARKPRPQAFLKSVEMLELPKQQVLYIGDQVFTDILGANLAGLSSVLVRYIGYDEPGYKGKRRAAEEKILRRYRKSKRYNQLRITEEPV